MGFQYVNAKETYFIPRNIGHVLVKDERFKKLSGPAIHLLELLITRASASAHNSDRYTDDEGHIYVFYTEEEIASDLRCTEKTGRKYLKELEAEDLIRKVSQGKNKPCLIYVSRLYRAEDFAKTSNKASDHANGPVKSSCPERKSLPDVIGNNDRSQQVKITVQDRSLLPTSIFQGSQDKDSYRNIGIEDPYTPEDFLMSIKGNAPLSQNEKRVIAAIRQRGFEDDVAIAMLRYILKKSGNKLVLSFVEMIADQWARDHVVTSEDVANEIHEQHTPAQHYGRKDVIPAWLEKQLREEGRSY